MVDIEKPEHRWAVEDRENAERNARLQRERHAAKSDKALGELITKICSLDAIKDAMEVSWDDICTDTGCHPLDITHGKNKHLIFRANHWADQIAKRLFIRALALAQADRANTSLDPGTSPQAVETTGDRHDGG